MVASLKRKYSFSGNWRSSGSGRLHLGQFGDQGEAAGVGILTLPVADISPIFNTNLKAIYCQHFK
jgi:hypothetical protein